MNKIIADILASDSPSPLATQYRLTMRITRLGAPELAERVRAGESLGEIAWHECRNRDLAIEGGAGDLPDWPQCECLGGCTEPATCIDAGGVPLCSACLDLAEFHGDTGFAHCSGCRCVEEIDP